MHGYLKKGPGHPPCSSDVTLGVLGTQKQPGRLGNELSCYHPHAGNQQVSRHHISSITKSSGDQDSGCITSLALMEKVALPTKVKLILNALKGHGNPMLWPHICLIQEHQEGGKKLTNSAFSPYNQGQACYTEQRGGALSKTGKESRN